MYCGIVFEVVCGDLVWLWWFAVICGISMDRMLTDAFYPYRESPDDSPNGRGTMSSCTDTSGNARAEHGM